MAISPTAPVAPATSTCAPSSEAPAACARSRHMSAVNTGTPRAAAAVSSSSSPIGATDACDARSAASGSSGAKRVLGNGAVAAVARVDELDAHARAGREPLALLDHADALEPDHVRAAAAGPSKKCPFQMWSSTGFSAAALIRTSASPGPRRGSGTSAGAGGRPGASTTAARTLARAAPDRRSASGRCPAPPRCASASRSVLRFDWCSRSSGSVPPTV